jgi:hypothetical protein
VGRHGRSARLVAVTALGLEPGAEPRDGIGERVARPAAAKSGNCREFR